MTDSPSEFEVRCQTENDLKAELQQCQAQCAHALAEWNQAALDRDKAVADRDAAQQDLVKLSFSNQQLRMELAYIAQKIGAQCSTDSVVQKIAELKVAAASGPKVRMRVLLVGSNDGYDGLYVDGKLVESGHGLDVRHVFDAMMERQRQLLASVDNLDEATSLRLDLQTDHVEGAANDYLERVGCFPETEAELRSWPPEEPAPTWRMIEPYNDEDGGDQVMTIDEFAGAVSVGAYTDDDGYGLCATEHKVSDVRIYASNLDRPSWATHVVWVGK